ncbi:hypothetical protein QAD02_013243 [Eretmocerus hayati]|uniref:Uncharacterized protein n=1 Tax=Eretmocerus hayati TaxID=131215 RepID=A0ACC2P3R1_9HYME|nr:hypothetical protein QAD02_013243 [Eretmocerus hayati]
MEVLGSENLGNTISSQGASVFALKIALGSLQEGISDSTRDRTKPKRLILSKKTSLPRIGHLDGAELALPLSNAALLIQNPMTEMQVDAVDTLRQHLKTIATGPVMKASSMAKELGMAENSKPMTWPTDEEGGLLKQEPINRASSPPHMA